MIIYTATNKVNGKIYVGQTIQVFKNRKKQHRVVAYNPEAKNYNSKFYRAIRKYGWDVFEWKVIDKADTQGELDNKEKYWISHFNCLDDSFGYNQQEGGSGGSPTKEVRIKISKGRGGKPFLIYRANGVFVKRYDIQLECAIELGLSAGNLNQMLVGEHHNLNGYFAIYEDEFTEELLIKKIKKANSIRKGSDNGFSKLTEENVIAIKEMLVCGISQYIIAKAFNVGQTTISAIARGEIWGYITVDKWIPSNRGNSKHLKLDEVIEIKRMLIQGVPHRKIAKEFGRGKTTITQINNEETWSNLKIDGWYEYQAKRQDKMNKKS
ncbi:helix-turn-helix domain-containing protein [Metabacillus sp. Hm71]|uniref:helix-turn-helix domain-containing protein n=1 Tax=Metabacillus sp. Hm71 TaxID=3450743 RepID=UPI003F426ECF